MTPAPGPISSPAGIEAGPADHAAINSVATGGNVIGPTHSSARAPLDRPNVGERTPSTLLTSIPKTCACCGGLLEATNEGQPRPMVSEVESLATSPSPSSVAFAPNPSSSLTSNAHAPRVSESSSIVTMLAETPVVMEVMQLEQQQQQQLDRPQFCSVCAVQREQNDSSTSVRPSAGVESQTDNDGDSVMGQGEHPARENRSTQTESLLETNVADLTNPAISSSSARTAIHPWRRQAPWANLRRASQQGPSHASSDDTPPLTISVGNMGAGGDAVAQNDLAAVEDDNDFPPLARSPSAGSPNGLATSPRLPLSPSRSARPASSGPISPPSLGRQASFSRSQSSATMNAAAATVAPVVNVPAARGRHRAGSSSGTLSTVPTAGVRGRRLSGTRRLSRSSSSQGPTSVSFADVGETVASPSILLDESLRAEAIEEDPFGPSSMTRPRLSTLPTDKEDKAMLSRANVAPPPPSAVDVFKKPFVMSELLKSAWTSCETDESKAQEQQLRWFISWRPDPRVDISHLRSQSAGRGCLFPGAMFRGTQKSGRMSYDVSVQIVNVDLNASHLGGYLNIRGLTDDWPELTTYFDAEIIGQRYGFITDKWGATEADDLKHWGRFTPFRPIRSSLTRPGLRFNHLNKPYVFMRWKERFLVPDHRVRDINGASFAGFYYVCVELGEDANTPSQSLTSPASPLSSPGAPPTRARNGTEAGDMDSAGFNNGVAGATATEGTNGYFPSDVLSSTSGRMSGFYFHEHSEPYQQLTLRHVAEPSSTTFEMR